MWWFGRATHILLFEIPHPLWPCFQHLELPPVCLHLSGNNTNAESNATIPGAKILNYKARWPPSWSTKGLLEVAGGNSGGQKTGLLYLMLHKILHPQWRLSSVAGMGESVVLRLTLASPRDVGSWPPATSSPPLLCSLSHGDCVWGVWLGQSRPTTF